jgi:hypothetical protein
LLTREYPCSQSVISKRSDEIKPVIRYVTKFMAYSMIMIRNRKKKLIQVMKFYDLKFSTSEIVQKIEILIEGC